MLLTTCFACTRDEMVAWADALKRRDEAALDAAQAKMAFALELDLVTQTEVEALSVATGGRKEVTGDITGDLIAAATDDAGPFVFSLDKDVMRSIAAAEVQPSLLSAWVDAARAFTAAEPEYYEGVLTEEAARGLVQFAQKAIVEGREAFMVAGG